MSPALVPPNEGDGIAREPPPHESREQPRTAAHQEVYMVVQQGPGVYGRSGLLGGLTQPPHKRLPLLPVPKDLPPFDASDHPMVKRPRQTPSLTRHTTLFTRPSKFIESTTSPRFQGATSCRPADACQPLCRNRADKPPRAQPAYPRCPPHPRLDPQAHRRPPRPPLRDDQPGGQSLKCGVTRPDPCGASGQWRAADLALRRGRRPVVRLGGGGG